jgi:hypothetical protein
MSYLQGRHRINQLWRQIINYVVFIRADRFVAMKTCDYCGYENDDDAKHCSGCGTEIVTEKEVEPSVRPDHAPATITRDGRYKLLIVAGLAVAVLTFPGIIFLPASLPKLPVGLLRLFGFNENQVNPAWSEAIWFVYIVLIVSACLTPRKRRYFIIYTILCIILALNVVGCRIFWADFSHIE